MKIDFTKGILSKTSFIISLICIFLALDVLLVPVGILRSKLGFDDMEVYNFFVGLASLTGIFGLVWERETLKNKNYAIAGLIVSLGSKFMLYAIYIYFILSYN